MESTLEPLAESATIERFISSPLSTIQGDMQTVNGTSNGKYNHKMKRALSQPDPSMTRPAFKPSDAHIPCALCLEDIKEIENYEIIKEIGSGAYSHVKLGHLKGESTLVVLKILTKKSPENRQIYETEASTLSQLKHPNIIQLLHSFETPQFYCIVLEYIQGRELFHFIETKELNEDQKKFIFHQLCTCVHYMHSQQIAHRDLKTENILISNDFKLTLIDFGFACKISTSDLTTDHKGSSQYASPEVVMCLPYDPKKADIWSLGVILYALMTGELPFVGDTNESQRKSLHRIARADYHFPMPLAQFDEEVVFLIRSILVTQPAKRPSIDTILENPWLQSTRDALNKFG